MWNNGSTVNKDFDFFVCILYRIEVEVWIDGYLMERGIITKSKVGSFQLGENYYLKTNCKVLIV